MSHFITLMKSNIIKQTRSYRFFLIIAISIFLGILCVPGKSAGYEILYLGGVRGIYNSAWLGVLSAVLPVILLWLPGFYLLRSQITEDKNLKIGQMIASSAVSKSRYIYGKLLTNFSVFMFLQLIFLAAIMVMQLILHESLHFSLLKYIQPMLFVTVPYLLVLSSLTILFDIVPFLKNTFGNIAIFIVWLALSMMSIANPGKIFDLFGIGTLLNNMLDGAKVYFPNLPDEFSFGYYQEASQATFEWSGVTWTKEFLVSRLLWIAIAIVITQLSVFIFNRFKEDSKSKVKSNIFEHKNQEPKNPILQTALVLSPVKRSKRVNYLQMIWGELKIMLRGRASWWYLLVLATIAFSPLVSEGEAEKWIALSMLLPIAIWAEMGNKDKACDTKNFIDSSCSATTKWMVTWGAGIIVAAMMSAGMFIRIALLSEWNYLLPWQTGLIFIPTLALILGSISGSHIVFEAVFIVLTYFGPINSMGSFDFMGLTKNNTILYLAITGILFCIGITQQILKEKRLIGVRR